MHVLLSLCDGNDRYVPTAQGEQVAASRSGTHPSGHAVHIFAPGDSVLIELAEFGKHALHALCPVTFANLPNGHNSHSTSVFTAENLPCSQGKQDVSVAIFSPGTHFVVNGFSMQITLS